MEKTKRLKTFSGAAAAAVVSLLILVLNLLGVWRGCVFRAVTGIACPTCGMTRAYLSLLKLDLKSAFYYHPLFWVVPAIAGLLLIKKAGSKSGLRCCRSPRRRFWWSTCCACLYSATA